MTSINSYIGKRFEDWAKKYPNDFSITKISLRNDSWKDTDFSGYDSVIHLAGIAHVSSDPKLRDEYYRVNRDLTIEVAKKAKSEGVGQFVFMSSVIIYAGIMNSDANFMIDRSTVPLPRDFYGDSKLQAEIGLNELSSEDFRVAIVRAPMIYGRDSKGNYHKLALFARYTPVFPNNNNRRSMLHIDHLCEFLRLLVLNKEQGISYPQNREYVNTSEMVRLIAETHHRKVILVTIFNPIIKYLVHHFEIFNKVFGNLAIDQAVSEYPQEYRLYDLKNSIEITERDR